MTHFSTHAPFSNIKVLHQGGVFALIQRLPSDFGERLKSIAESTQTVGTSSLSDRESDLGVSIFLSS